MKTPHIFASFTVLATLAFTTGHLINFAAISTTSQAAGTLTLYTTPGSVAVTSGQQTTLHLRMSKSITERVNYVDIHLRFNPGLLEVQSIAKNGSAFADQSGPVATFNNSSGVIRVTGSGDNLGDNVDVFVASITFRVNSPGTSGVSFAADTQAGNKLSAKNIRNYVTSTSGSTIAGLQPAAPSRAQPAPPPIAPVQVSTPEPIEAVIDEEVPDGEEQSDESIAAVTEQDDASGGNGDGGVVLDDESTGAKGLSIGFILPLLGMLLAAVAVGLAQFKNRLVKSEEKHFIESTQLSVSPEEISGQIDHTAALGRLAAYAIAYVPEQYLTESSDVHEVSDTQEAEPEVPEVEVEPKLPNLVSNTEAATSVSRRAIRIPRRRS